jgi:hypothetical protein
MRTHAKWGSVIAAASLMMAVGAAPALASGRRQASSRASTLNTDTRQVVTRCSC